MERNEELRMDTLPLWVLNLLSSLRTAKVKHNYGEHQNIASRELSFKKINESIQHFSWLTLEDFKKELKTELSNIKVSKNDFDQCLEKCENEIIEALNLLENSDDLIKDSTSGKKSFYKTTEEWKE